MATRGKAVQFSRTGNPAEVVELVELDEPDPAAGEILCRIEAAPIAPSHILTLSGAYGDPPELPAVPGNDALAQAKEAVAHAMRDARSGKILFTPQVEA